MRAALETILVILAVLIQSAVYAMAITCLTTLTTTLISLSLQKAGVLAPRNADGCIGVAIVIASPVLSLISSVTVGERWYLWLRDRRVARSPASAEPDAACAQTAAPEAQTATPEAQQTAAPEAPAPPPEPPGAARPSTIPQARGPPPAPHIRPRRALAPPPPPPRPVSIAAQRPPSSGGAAETGVESLNHKREVLPSPRTPIHSLSGDRSLAAVLVLPCNHVALCPALSDMCSVATCPVCGGGVREAIRQAQT